MPWPLRPSAHTPPFQKTPRPRTPSHRSWPTSPSPLHPPSFIRPRGPPQTELAMEPMGSDGGQVDEVAQESLPDDLDQSPEFDPADPEPLPEDDFDQSRGA